MSASTNRVRPPVRTPCHRHRAVQFHDWSRQQLDQSLVQLRDADPIGLSRRYGPGHGRRRSSLQDVGTARARALRSLERGEAAANQELIPRAAVLVQQQDGLSRGTDSGPSPRRLDFHERHEPVHLRLSRSQLGQNTSETKGLVAELGRIQSSPAVAE